MALIVKDRVRETSTTTGTGTITLAGAVSGFQSFSVIGDGNTTYYTIVDATAGEWEVGVGTYTLSGTTLQRNQVLESSSGGALINFASNTKDVFVTYPAEKSFTDDSMLDLIGTDPNQIPLNQFLGTMAYQDSIAVAITGGSVNGTTVGASTASTGSFTDLTSTTDATLSGVRVGKGAGVIATNTALGSGALNANTTGVSNTASGVNTLLSNTTGSYNTASGFQALLLNTTGGNNTASGASALLNNTTGSSNTASGFQALHSNTTGIANTANGLNALYFNTTGAQNTAIGVNALQNNTTGASNTASGHSALLANTTGIANTAIGVNALYSNTTGNNNTASGIFALLNNTTGSGNTGINPLNSAGTYAPVFNPTTENNRFCMGSTGVTDAYIQVAWTVVSDARDKTNFAPVPYGLEFVKALQPTAYQFRTARDSEETNGRVRYGFKAQDVLALEGANPVIVDNEDEDKLRMVDTALIPVLVKAIQELSAEVDNRTQQLGALK